MHEVIFYVEAGGLMSYSSNDADQYKRAAIYVDKILRCEACRPAGGTADAFRSSDQSENRQADRFDNPAERAGAGGQGDSLRRKFLRLCSGQVFDFRFWILE